MTTVDYKKNVPVLGSYEVVVAGAGPAGICAAVAAARSGARVALVERYGVLGGNLCCFSERMRKLFRKNEKNVLRFCNKKAKEKRRLQRVKKPM